MAFRKKADFILAHKPDILIVPECEHPDKLNFDTSTQFPNNILWQGTNPNKGLGVFSYGQYQLKLLDVHNPELKTILPIAVSGGAFDFILMAIWAYNPGDRDYNYIGQVWKAINYYEKILKTENIIIAGDFNSNVIWDKLKRKSNHSMVVDKLLNMRIFSTYHIHLKQTQGMELHPTFFMYRNKNKPYHIDYCFASDHLIQKLKNVEIGAYEQWSIYSDHKPLIITFKD
jgi:exonuclease III